MGDTKSYSRYLEEEVDPKYTLFGQAWNYLQEYKMFVSNLI
jgi:hypothetical protein